MNSSISSSDTDTGLRFGGASWIRRPSVRVFGFILMVLVGLELASRKILVNASKDLKRFRHYPQQATRLDRTAGVRIAFIGNSATDEGVLPDRLASTLAVPLDRPVHVHKFVADASRINTWHHIVNRYFWQPGNQPDLFVVTFYEDDLQDGNRIEIGRLAQFFTSVGDWPSVFEIDLVGVDDRIDFVLSSFWMTFAVRSRIKERVLGALLPNYKAWLSALNAANRQRPLVATDQVVPAIPASLRALIRFVESARVHGSRVIFVAYPLPWPDGTPGDPYPLHPDVQRFIGQSGMPLVDLRKVPGLRPDHFADDVHLTPQGAALYTDALADRLRPLLSQTGRMGSSP